MSVASIKVGGKVKLDMKFTKGSRNIYTHSTKDIMMPNMANEDRVAWFMQRLSEETKDFQSERCRKVENRKHPSIAVCFL